MTSNANIQTITPEMLAAEPRRQSVVMPGRWIGMLGGGQLGRMFCQAAQRMGYHVAVFESECDCPAGQVADHHFCPGVEAETARRGRAGDASQGSDEAVVLEMSKLCEVITLEFENISTELLRIAGRASPTHPSADFLEICQDRLREKTALQQAGFPVTPFAPVAEFSRSSVLAAAEQVGWPLVLKTTRSGYDGKGQVIVRGPEDVDKALQQLADTQLPRREADENSTEEIGSTRASETTSSQLKSEASKARAARVDPSAAEKQTSRETGSAGSEDCKLPEIGLIAEKWIEFDSEVSLITARNARGQIESFPLFENNHADHILDVSRCPVSAHLRDLETRATEICHGIASEFGVLGLFCVEFFVTSDGALMINEIAPRPHNSGHLTIEAFTCSQFEQQLRAVCNLPLVPATMLRPAAMVNLLGDLWHHGEPDWTSVLAAPAAHLHLYGKSTPRPGRKMGHITVLDESASEAAITARELRDALRADGEAHST